MIANIAEYRVCCEKFRNIQSSFKMLRVVECIESKVRIILKVFSLKFITNLTPENRNQVKCWYSLSANDLTIGWQNLNPLSNPNATLGKQGPVVKV